jgi:hypothetical protein
MSEDDPYDPHGIVGDAANRLTNTNKIQSRKPRSSILRERAFLPKHSTDQS